MTDRLVQIVAVTAFRPRVLMMVFTLEASAVTNLLTSLPAGDTTESAGAVTIAAAFFLVASSYALAIEGLLTELLSKGAVGYDERIRENWRDLAWWSAAHTAAIVYGTIMLWPIREG